MRITGAGNVWANNTRCWTPSDVVRRVLSGPILPLCSSGDFCWRSSSEVAATQAAVVASAWDSLTYSTGGIVAETRRAVWTTVDAVDLQLRLGIIAYTVPAGHRVFHWIPVFSSTFSSEVETSFRSCIQRLSMVGREKSFLWEIRIDVTSATERRSQLLLAIAFPDSVTENAVRMIMVWVAAFRVYGSRVR